MKYLFLLAMTFHLHQAVIVTRMPAWFAGCNNFGYVERYYPVSGNYIVPVWCPYTGEEQSGTYESLHVRAEDLTPWLRPGSRK